LTNRDAHISALAVAKIAAIYMGTTAPEGSTLDPGAFRATCSTVRNIVETLAAEAEFPPAAPAAPPPAPAAAPPVTAPVPPAAVSGLGVGEYPGLQLAITKIAHEVKMSAKNVPYIGIEADGIWWNVWGQEGVNVARAAGKGGVIQGKGEVKPRDKTKPQGPVYRDLQDAHLVQAGGV
jgi:hypothetical protein